MNNADATQDNDYDIAERRAGLDRSRGWRARAWPLSHAQGGRGRKLAHKRGVELVFQDTRGPAQAIERRGWFSRLLGL